MKILQKKNWIITSLLIVALLSFLWFRKQMSDETSIVYQLYRLAFSPVRYADQQMVNFQKDLAKAQNYAIHEDAGWKFLKVGNYDKAIEEYKKSIEIIENNPGDSGKLFKKNPNDGKFYELSAEEMKQVNEESKAFKQGMARRYLYETYEKSGHYYEALEQIDWLLAHKPLEHVRQELVGKKEELLKLLAVKNQSSKSWPTTSHGKS